MMPILIPTITVLLILMTYMLKTSRKEGEKSMKMYNFKKKSNE